jgi:hypothetical protein
MTDYIKEHPIEIITFTVLIISGCAVCYSIGYFAGLITALPLVKAGELVIVKPNILQLLNKNIDDIYASTSVYIAIYKNGGLPAEAMVHLKETQQIAATCQDLLVVISQI